MSLQSRWDARESEQYLNGEAVDPEGLLWMMAERDAGRLIECLDDGFVRLVDSMGDDSAVSQAARVSYGAGTRSVSDDRGLIRYLMSHRHTTPFEMVEVKFHIRIPMDAWRQMIRTRTANVNEYSTRYSVAIDSAQETPAGEWRLQATDNKQGSSGFVTECPPGVTMENFGDDKNITELRKDGELIGLVSAIGEPGAQTPGEYLSYAERDLQEKSRQVYNARLALGVAREQARKDLPLSTYTEAYWKIDLHNLLHFLGLRMDKHAQLEIRTFANAMFKLISPLVPLCCEAFLDYRLNAMSLSHCEIHAIAMLSSGVSYKVAIDRAGLGKREAKEFKNKLSALNLWQESYGESNEQLAA